MAPIQPPDCNPLFRRIAALAFAGAALAFVGTAPTASAATIVVTPATPTWSLIVETPTASGTFVTGPATPPAGTGSLQLVNGPSGGGILFSTLSHSGRRLDDIAALGYSAYVVSAAGPSITASLQLDVDYDVTDGTTTWQGRLVYDPGSSGGAVPAATWIDYDTQAGPPRWWSTGTPIVGNTPLAKACSQASPCTWAQVLANYPNAAIRPLVGGFGVKLGNAGAAATVAVDRVVIAGTIYDFEPTGTPPVSNCGGFSDVTTSDIYCGAVEWLKNRAVTLGCTATTYCPNDVVTRASMALFLNRLGTTLSPLPTLTQQQTASLPVVPFAVICQTAPTGAATYARTSVAQWSVNLLDSSSGVLSSVYPVLSIDGGVNWLVYANGTAVNGGAGQWRNVAGTANADIGAGESPRFGIGVIGNSGVAIAASQCQLNTMLINRNPAQSPLDTTALRPLTDFVGR